MARYFEAPVVKREQYAFQYPIEPIYKVLQDQQKLQDEGLSQAMKLYDVNKQNVIKQVEDINLRDKLIAQRNKEVDNIIYDNYGNIRDLRNVMGQVQDIARRRALEEQTGGGIHALSTNLALQEDNDKYISELMKKGTKGGGISQEHGLFAMQQARRDYHGQGGVGMKNEQGFYQSYTPYEPALYINPVDTALDIAEGWKTDKFQQGMIDKVTGKFSPTEEFRATMQAKYPNYVNVNAGMLQTGTMEIATVEEIYKNTWDGLVNDTGLVEYLKQEAQFKGGATNNTEVEKYVEDQLHNAASIAAKKYSTMLFEGKAYDDWMAKEDYKNLLAKQRIDYQLQKEQPMQVLSTSSQNMVYAPDPELTLKNYNKAISSRDSFQKIVDDLLNAEGVKGDISKLGPTNLNIYMDAMDNIQNLNSQIAAQKQVLDKADSVIEKSGTNLYLETAYTINNTLFGDILPKGHKQSEAFGIEVLKWLKAQYDTPGDLRDALSKQQIPGLSTAIKEISNRQGGVVEAVQRSLAASDANGSALSKALTDNNMFYGAKPLSDSYDTKRKKAIATLNGTGGVESQAQFQFFSSSESGEGSRGAVKVAQDDANFHIENGTTDAFTVFATGQNFRDIKSYADGLGTGQLIHGSTQTFWSGEITPQGNRIYKVTFDTKQGEHTKKHTVVLEQKRGTGSNLGTRAKLMGVQMIQSSTATPGEENKKDLLTRGHLLIGTENFGKAFADAGVYTLQPGDPSVIVYNYKNAMPAYQVTRLRNGNYVLNTAHSVAKLDPNDVLNELSPNYNRLVKDARYWAGTEGANQYKDLNAVYEQLGLMDYNREVNEMAKYQKGRTSTFIQEPIIED